MGPIDGRFGGTATALSGSGTLDNLPNAAMQHEEAKHRWKVRQAVAGRYSRDRKSV